MKTSRFIFIMIGCTALIRGVGHADPSVQTSEPASGQTSEQPAGPASTQPPAGDQTVNRPSTGGTSDELIHPLESYRTMQAAKSGGTDSLYPGLPEGRAAVARDQVSKSAQPAPRENAAHYAANFSPEFQPAELGATGSWERYGPGIRGFQPCRQRPARTGFRKLAAAGFPSNLDHRRRGHRAHPSQSCEPSCGSAANCGFHFRIGV